MNDDYIIGQLKDKIDELTNIKRSLIENLGFRDEGFVVQALDQVIDELCNEIDRMEEA